MTKIDLFRNCKVFDHISRRLLCKADASLIGKGMANEISLYICSKSDTVGKNVHFTTFEDFKQFSNALQAFIAAIEEKTHGGI